MSSVRIVKVWRVDYAVRHHVTGDWLPESESWPGEEYIRNRARDLEECGEAACINVTGPHQQKVPARGWVPAKEGA